MGIINKAREILRPIMIEAIQEIDNLAADLALPGDDKRAVVVNVLAKHLDKVKMPWYLRWLDKNIILEIAVDLVVFILRQAAGLKNKI